VLNSVNALSASAASRFNAWSYAMRANQLGALMLAMHLVIFALQSQLDAAHSFERFVGCQSPCKFCDFVSAR
jgi:hypothetical protein